MTRVLGHEMFSDTVLSKSKLLKLHVIVCIQGRFKLIQTSDQNAGASS